jgi:hypothetical protein
MPRKTRLRYTPAATAADRTNFPLVPFESWIPSSDVIRRADVTMHAFRHLLLRGIIRCIVRNERNWAMYHISEIPKIVAGVKPEAIAGAELSQLSKPGGYTTEQAVDVFTRLAANEPLSQICIAVRVHPTTLLAIASDYAMLSDCLFIPEHVMRQINELPLEGEFPISNAEDLLAIMQRAARSKKCAFCKTSELGIACVGCVRRRALTEFEERAKEKSLQARGPEAFNGSSDDAQPEGDMPFASGAEAGARPRRL